MPSPGSTRRLGRRGATSLEFALTGAILMAFLVGAALWALGVGLNLVSGAAVGGIRRTPYLYLLPHPPP